MSDEPDVEGGTVIAIGGEGLLESHWSQALTRHNFDVTFCSIPIDDANCYYLDRLIFGALAERRKPANKRGSGGGVATASPMIKLAKGWRR